MKGRAKPISTQDSALSTDSSRPRILLADDNADMREYVRRLLNKRYDVEAVADGEAALAAVRRQPPDLVLTDAMMPRLDGFELLKALRAGPDTRTIPIILLSARAGEESRVEGLEAGADDYLIKPFSAREVIARVAAHLEMASMRRENERRERALRTEAEQLYQDIKSSHERYRLLNRATNDVIWDWDLLTDRVDWNEAVLPNFGYTKEEMGPTSQAWMEKIHPDDRGRVVTGVHAVIDGGSETWSCEYRFRRKDGSYATFFDRGFVAHDSSGKAYRMIGSMLD